MKYGLVETEKLYFSSAEAAELVGVPVKVLHSWEKKIPEFKPKKNKAGKRVYSQIDIETAKQIKNGLVCPVPTAKLKTKQATLPSANDKELLLKIRNDLLKHFLRIHGN